MSDTDKYRLPHPYVHEHDPSKEVINFPEGSSIVPPLCGREDGPELVLSPSKKKTIRIRIQNGGTEGYNTKITDAETGSEVENVGSLTWSFDYRSMPTVVLTVFDPVIDIIADAEIRHICPACGRENEDG